MGNHDQWYDFVGGAGKIQIGVLYRPHLGQSLTIEEFDLMTVIGKGSFGKVCTAALFWWMLIANLEVVGIASPET